MYFFKHCIVLKFFVYPTQCTCVFLDVVFIYLSLSLAVHFFNKKVFPFVLIIGVGNKYMYNIFFDNLLDSEPCFWGYFWLTYVLLLGGPDLAQYAGKKHINRGRWNKEEDEKLKRLVEINGERWDFIASHFPDRADVQCQHRWQKVVNPELVKGTLHDTLLHPPLTSNNLLTKLLLKNSIYKLCDRWISISMLDPLFLLISRII